VNGEKVERKLGGRGKGREGWVCVKGGTEGWGARSGGSGRRRDGYV